MRLGIGVSEDLPVAQQQQIARNVESHGFASLWTNEARGRDAFVLCAAWAAATSSLDVGVGVVPLWTRTPVQLAMGAATLQDLSGGRFLLGLGVSHPVTMQRWHDRSYTRPVTAARELLELLEAIESGQRVRAEGDVFRVADFQLEITSSAPPSRRYLAAMGPRMLELAGTHADGVLLNWSGPGEVERAAAIVRNAADRRGRGRADVEVASYVRIAVGESRRSAQRALSREIAKYARLDAYVEHFGRQGFSAMVDRVRALPPAAHVDNPDALVTAVGDEALGVLGWAGGPEDDPRKAVAAWRAAGLDHFIARVVATGPDAGDDVARVVDRFSAMIDV
ncbi:MAG: LLM class flavin-dependent oxidoreductase [Nitriliruptoraceae bacterium]